MIKYLSDGHLFAPLALVVLIAAIAVAALHCGRHNTVYILPSLKCSSLAFYYIFLRVINGSKLQTAPPLCLLLQCFCGLCKIFNREKIVQVWILNRPYVYFFKPETVEVLLSSTVNTEKSNEYRFLHPWLGTGLLTSKGEKWRMRRKLLTPAFHFCVLEDFLPIFDEQSRVLVSKLKTMCDKPWVDIMPLTAMCTLDILCQTAMGVTINAQSGYNEYVTAINEMGEIFSHRVLRPWFWIDAIFYCFPSGRKFKANLQILHTFTRKVIKEKKQAMLEYYSEDKVNEKESDDSAFNRNRRRAFLDLLLQHHISNKSLTEEDIREEVDTFMFEGHDTTTVAICWTLYNLGLLPEIQEEVHKELDSIFEDHTSGPITRDDLTRMKYLECVIKETLRLYPPAPIFARELREDIKVLDYRIAAGSVCVLFPLMLHRDPESFPNPEKFQPERFLPVNCHGRHPYAFVPFSAGPRNCIGQKFAVMEVKAVLANVLRHFNVESLDHRDKVNVILDFVASNVDPLRIRFTARC